MAGATNRTDELRRRGAERLGTGGSAPFVMWPENDVTTYVEGRVEEVWEGRFGNVARIAVHRASEGATAVTGSGEARAEAPIEPGSMINVGLNYACLSNVGADHEGKVLHIAYYGWSETEAGQRFRMFEVFELADDEKEATGGELRDEGDEDVSIEQLAF